MEFRHQVPQGLQAAGKRAVEEKDSISRSLHSLPQGHQL